MSAPQSNGNGSGGGGGGSGGDSLTVQGGGSGSNLVDLSGAGPGGTLLGCNGTGGEFGNHGGPFNFSATANGYPGGTITPTSAYMKTLPIDDPLALPMPTDPSNPGGAGGTVTIAGLGAGATNGCQLPIGSECTLYSPGVYAAGIDVQNQFALLNPGIYYITSGGFSIRSNGIVHMAPCTSANESAQTGCGVLIYNSPSSATDIINITANGGQYQGVSYTQELSVVTPVGTQTVTCTGNCFQGPPDTAPYYGVVFMNNRSTTFAQEHEFQGGGGLTIAGTLYFTNSYMPGKADLAGSSNYQKVDLQGTPGSSTQVVGQILVDTLELSGNSTITMTLNPFTTLPIRKLALVR